MLWPHHHLIFSTYFNSIFLHKEKLLIISPSAQKSSQLLKSAISKSNEFLLLFRMAPSSTFSGSYASTTQLPCSSHNQKSNQKSLSSTSIAHPHFLPSLHHPNSSNPNPTNATQPHTISFPSHHSSMLLSDTS